MLYIDAIRGRLRMLINSAYDAVAFLEKCWADTSFGGDEPLCLVSCAFSVTLDPGNGIADRKALKALSMVQEHFDRLYMVAKTGAPTGRLSEYERELLSLSFTVGTGSTKHGIDIVAALLAIQKLLPPGMPTRTRNIIIAGIAAVTILSPFTGQYTDYRATIGAAQIAADGKVREADVKAKADIAVAQVDANARVDIARIHANTAVAMATVNASTAKPNAPDAQLSLSMDRAKSFDGLPVILATLVRDDTTNLVRFAASDAVAWRPALYNLAPKGGTFQWNGETPIQAAAAKAYAAVARKDASKRRQVARAQGRPMLIETPWVTEVLTTHSAPGAMRLGINDA